MGARRIVAVRPLGLACLLGLLVGLVAPPAGRADVDISPDPWFVNWSSLLPAGYLGVDTDSSDLCQAGRIQCVDRVAVKLERQLSDQQCGHNAVFSLAYARTTEAVAAWERENPAFFSDNPWLNHYDATFANFYFTAFNNWRQGLPAPPAWQMAFDAAARKQVSASGNLLLGMSAHVNRDLPFTLYAIGLVAPDGSSRKPDHDRVNQILDAIVTPLIDEIAAKYDPSVRTIPGLGSLGDFLTFQALPAWGEEAWRNAERLATAPDAATRAAVAASIDAAAAQEATALIALTRYLPPVTTSAARDAYCAAHVS
jgi:hypothetical protein